MYAMIKRRWPKLRSMRGLGLLLLYISILIFVHIGPFSDLRIEGDTELKTSIIGQTYEKTLLEINGPKQEIGGGLVGATFFALFYFLFGHYGTLMVNGFMMLVAIMLLTGFTLERGFHTIRKTYRYIKSITVHYMNQLFQRHKLRHATNVQQDDDGVGEADYESNATYEQEVPDDYTPPMQSKSYMPLIHDFFAEKDTHQHEQMSILVDDNDEEEASTVGESDSGNSDVSAVEIITEAPSSSVKQPNAEYRLPSYSLLNKPKKGSARDQRDLTNNAHKLEQTLKSFGVNARVSDYHRGPAVTRYEVQPDTGVKVSRIVSLTDDLALALAAKDIRMEAPIPGKSAIGIEVPNESVSMVSLREVLESSQFHEHRSKLSVALGRDISGEPIVADLAKMPHLLVAGATGSGKSVCINSIVASILYKAKPHEVKMMMIDPKMVELNVYNGIPHLLTPVVTDPRKASLALRKIVAEMERRYEVFAAVGAKDIERYNHQLIAQNDEAAMQGLLPYIVVIVDELADLMMVASSDVEDSITRLAQKARACGIHLILATQRPSVDVITGVIKANIPSRIAFSVSSQVDSRTILDMAGAEKLLGKGDMLYLPMGSSKVTRIQGCYVDDHEIEAVVQAIKQEQEVQYIEEMIPDDVPEADGYDMEDDLYDRAVSLIAEAQTASVSLLQRRLRVGYARAARLMDMMEQRGIVGPYEGSKPREVYVARHENSNIS